MFGDIDQLKTMQKKVDAVSPSFCLAKWLHVSIHLLNGRTHSCYLPMTHKIPVDEIAKDPSALHNTSYKKEQRRLMKAGERPSECNICWSIEDLKGDQVSDRRYRSVDDWTMPFLDKVAALPWDAPVNPTYVEVAFSDRCNFKCAYCSPHVSSAWLAETVKHGPFELSDGAHQHLDWFRREEMLAIPEGEHNPYIEAFWKWWPDLVRDLMYFRITGGEPLLSEDTFRVLEWLDKNPQPQLELSINSNLGVPQKFMDRFFAAVTPLLREKKIKGFMLHTSIDTHGAQAEYIRNGLDFEQFDRNVRRYLRELPNGQLAFMCAFNNLSVVGFRRFLDWVIELRGEFNNEHRTVLLDIPHLMGPSMFSAKILPRAFDALMEKHILHMRNHLEKDGRAGFRPAEIDKMRRILEWMRSPNDDAWIETARKNFYLFFLEHDRRRGTDFLGTFPEMKEFWRECKALNGTRKAR